MSRIIFHGSHNFMDIAVIAIGRLKKGLEKDLCIRYLERIVNLGGRLGFRSFHHKELIELKAASILERQRLEAQKIRTALHQQTQGTYIICLDEKGKHTTSQDFAQKLDLLKQTYSLCSFIIGGDDGLEEKLKKESHELLALSSMTLPHQLARIVLLEQIYRAMTILSHHPYHRS